MRLGLIARMDNSGLGIQTHNFYKFMNPARTMVVDISKFNGNRQYPERYPEATFIKGFPQSSDIDKFLDDLDVVFIAEAAYNPYLYSRAKELGVKVANQYNYEFFDWFNQPNELLPDMFIAPSLWNFKKVQDLCDERGIKHIYLHCPVDRSALPQRQIKQARVFLHVAGRSAAYDRNGTICVIRASRFLQSNAKIVIHFQGEQGLAHQTTTTYDEYLRLAETEGDLNRLSIQKVEFDNYQDVYAQGDVLLLPRRYGGNCLPMNEALSLGMPVIMSNISPNNKFLPHTWLIPAEQVGEFTPRTTVQIYGCRPRNLAHKIDDFYAMDEDTMWFENTRAGNIAQTISWDVMKAKYEEAFEDLLND